MQVSHSSVIAKGIIAITITIVIIMSVSACRSHQEGAIQSNPIQALLVSKGGRPCGFMAAQSHASLGCVGYISSRIYRYT